MEAIVLLMTLASLAGPVAAAGEPDILDRPSLGVEVTAPPTKSDPPRHTNVFPKRGGVYVERVYPGGAADAASVHAGSVIHAVNGVDVPTVGAFEELVAGLEPGRTVEFTRGAPVSSAAKGLSKSVWKMKYAAPARVTTVGEAAVREMGEFEDDRSEGKRFRAEGVRQVVVKPNHVFLYCRVEEGAATDLRWRISCAGAAAIDWETAEFSVGGEAPWPVTLGASRPVRNSAGGEAREVLDAPVDAADAGLLAALERGPLSIRLTLSGRGVSERDVIFHEATSLVQTARAYRMLRRSQ